MGDLLKTLAPTLASALLGPLGGVAVAAIGKVIGIPDATTEKLSKVFEDGKLTPEHLAEIQRLELQYKAEESERGFRYAELEFKSADSARAMQVATNSTTPTILTYLLTVGFFGILGWMLHDESVVESAPIMIMLGSLGTAWTSSVAFWFGSTHGSQGKDKLLANSIPAK